MEDKSNQKWQFSHPRYKVVTMADVIKRKEQEYITKLRSQSVINEKDFQEVALRKGSLRWQDSVK